jgi:hypothetical protein
MFGRRTKILVSVGVLSLALSFSWMFLWKRSVDIRNEQLRKSPPVVNRDGSVGWDAPIWSEFPGVPKCYFGTAHSSWLWEFSLSFLT